MKIETLREENKLINLFCELAQIPSPSLKEEKVARRIVEFLEQNGVPCSCDLFGNVIAKVKATDSAKQPLLLSAHMDVVGDDSPVNIGLSSSFIETDKRRTLGADDKAGVAAAMLLAVELQNNEKLNHGGLELVFTKDEEHSMSGIKNLDMSKLESEYILVLDADKLGQVLVSGASFTKLTIDAEAFIGGHSGIDIADEKRLNAIKLIAELISDIPQGVYKKDDFGVVASINAGAILGGGVSSSLSKLKENKVPPDDLLHFVLDNSMTNIINTRAGVVYSLRSSDKQVERELIGKIAEKISLFNKKYEGLAKASLKEEEHLPAFEKSEDETIVGLAIKAAQKVGIKADISSFHAGAETHIYANNTNKSGKAFKPCLIGLADVYNMHSSDEKIDYKSYIKGYEFLKMFFEEFNA